MSPQQQKLGQPDRPLVQMVVQLKPNGPSGKLLTPDESAELADLVLKRVAEEVGRSAARVNVMRNIASMIVEADRDFQSTLTRQPEVKSVIPNRVMESFAIPPVNKRDL